MNKHTAIIIVNWNSFDVTHNCILSLKKMPYQDFSIIVVDNASADGSGEKLRQAHPDCDFIMSTTNAGFAGGNNMALNYAINRSYSYALLLNNDTLAEPFFLEILVDYMDQHPEVAGVQPRIFFEHDRNLIWNGGSYFNTWTGQTSTYGYHKRSDSKSEMLKEVDWITGCAFLMRTSVLPDAGLLDESYFMYYEDTDLSFRIRRLGYKLMYHPQSIIYHIAGGAFKQLKQDSEGSANHHVHYHNARNQIWLIKKFVSPLQKITAYLFTFLYITAVLCYFILRWRKTKFMTYIKGVKAGITGRATGNYHFNNSI